MKEYLYVLIAIPMASSLLELFLKKMGFKTRLAGVFSLVALAACFVISATQDFGSSYNSIEWIPGLKINFIISMNDIATTLLPAILLVMLCSALISKAEDKDGEYYFFIMLLTTSISGFCMSSDLVLKIFFWETCWIPIFFTSLSEDKKTSAKIFSTTWFISEFALLLGAVITNGHLQELAFWLFMIAVYIRIASFPLDKLTDRYSAEGSNGFSTVVNIILPTLPLIFMVQVILPSFPYQIRQYGMTLYLVFLALGMLRTLRSIVDKNLNSIINSQIIVFNSIFAGFILATGETSLNLILELITIKLLLNMVILFYGLESIRTGLNIKKPSAWIMIAAVIFSFGLPGVTFSKPLFSIISHINSIQVFTGFYSWILMLILLVLTSIRLANATTSKSRNTGSTQYRSVIMIMMMLLVIISVLLGYYNHV